MFSESLFFFFSFLLCVFFSRIVKIIIYICYKKNSASCIFSFSRKLKVKIEETTCNTLYQTITVFPVCFGAHLTLRMEIGKICQRDNTPIKAKKTTKDHQWVFNASRTSSTRRISEVVLSWTPQ